MVARGLVGEEGRVEHRVLRAADRPEDRGRAELPGDRQVLLLEQALHERLLVVRVVDDEAARDADRLPVLAEDPRAERVERPHRDVAAGLRPHEAHDPLAHLGGGLVRERDREDPPRRDALHPDEVRDPVREHAGLAAPGAGEDEDRPVRRLDGPTLLGVEPADDLRGSLRAAAGDLRLLLRGVRRAPERLRRRGGRGQLVLVGPAGPGADDVGADRDEVVVRRELPRRRLVHGLGSGRLVRLEGVAEAEGRLVVRRTSAHRPILGVGRRGGVQHGPEPAAGMDGDDTPAGRRRPRRAGGVDRGMGGRATARGSGSRSSASRTAAGRSPGRRAAARPSRPRPTCPSPR